MELLREISLRGKGMDSNAFANVNQLWAGLFTTIKIIFQFTNSPLMFHMVEVKIKALCIWCQVEILKIKLAQ